MPTTWRDRPPGSILARARCRLPIEQRRSNAIAQFCADQAVDHGVVTPAVSEAVANAVVHAYRDREPGPVRVTASFARLSSSLQIDGDGDGTRVSSAFNATSDPVLSGLGGRARSTQPRPKADTSNLRVARSSTRRPAPRFPGRRMRQCIGLGVAARALEDHATLGAD